MKNNKNSDKKDKDNYKIIDKNNYIISEGNKMKNRQILSKYSIEYSTNH